MRNFAYTPETESNLYHFKLQNKNTLYFILNTCFKKKFKTGFPFIKLSHFWKNLRLE